ncbi:hypothetical protein L3Y34_019513 [Caenorhabditis briggsae]|uniref:Uncharacterized protein n=1 Tax=Caenorhabditis briggsae TaxID=6238 RepID=A0AAE9DQ07_CAEBR|nr:hypothetical protein L3Y34_019513 [Caenorhabditis briggsae]
MPRTPFRLFSPIQFGPGPQDEESEETSSPDITRESEDTLEDPYTIDDIDYDDDESDLSSTLKSVSDEVLVFVAGACLERMSDSGFGRMLSSQDEGFRKQAWKLWKNDLTTFSIHEVCNGCGKEVDGSCCSEVIRYVRTGGFSQLIDIVKQHLESILSIRERLRDGTERTHNLLGSYIGRLWKSEYGNRLKLSLLGSVDGVNLNGNTRRCNKSFDFILEHRHKLDIYIDLERSIEVNGFHVQVGICSWVADQPAKRALFGMKGCNSEGSCFFGMCTGTHHNTKSEDRCVARADSLTDEDAANGRHGFGRTIPRVVNYCYPYDTVIDILHNASGGIFSLVLKETLPPSPNIERKSDLFQNNHNLHSNLCKSVELPKEFDIRNITNCSEKITFFRTSFGLSALVNPSLKDEARMVICSLMLLKNSFYTNVPVTNTRFYKHLCDSARWEVKPEDAVQELADFSLYATLTLSLGRLESVYWEGSVSNQIFFAVNNDGVHCCYKFIYVAVHGVDVYIYAEKIRSICGIEQFNLLKQVADNLPRPFNTFGETLLNQFKRYRGIVHGKPSGEREVVSFDSIRGVGAYIPDGSSAYIPDGSSAELSAAEWSLRLSLNLIQKSLMLPGDHLYKERWSGGSAQNRPTTTPVSGRYNVLTREQKPTKLDERMRVHEPAHKERGEMSDDYFWEQRNESSERVGLRREFSEEDDDSEQAESPSRKNRLSSSHNLWNPSDFIQNTCFDRVTGELLSRKQCLFNMNRATKKRKKTDFHAILKAKNCLAHRNIAYSLYMGDKRLGKNCDTRKDHVAAPLVGFDLDDGRKEDDEILLPGGKRVMISKLIDPTACTNWVGSTAVSKAVVSVLKLIQARDPYFLIYSSPESSRSTDYPPIDDDFFRIFANVLKAGFKIVESSSSLISLASSIRRTTRNYIDKQRKSATSIDLSKMLSDFMEKFKIDSEFRLSEPSIENCGTITKNLWTIRTPSTEESKKLKSVSPILSEEGLQTVDDSQPSTSSTPISGKKRIHQNHSEYGRIIGRRIITKPVHSSSEGLAKFTRFSKKGKLEK